MAQAAGAGSSGDDEIRRNVFKAYEEDGEWTKATEPESTGSTARFELLTKFQGMVLLDEDTEPVDEDSDSVPEFRRIVDLEWIWRKPKKWKGKWHKQWQVVTELIPEKHQAEIDAAGSLSATREGYFIDNDLYADIIKAPTEMQPRPIEQESADEMAGN